jgi:hypothetical protein
MEGVMTDWQLPPELLSGGVSSPGPRAPEHEAETESETVKIRR